MPYLEADNSPVCLESHEVDLVVVCQRGAHTCHTGWSKTFITSQLTCGGRSTEFSIRHHQPSHASMSCVLYCAGCLQHAQSGLGGAALLACALQDGPLTPHSVHQAGRRVVLVAAGAHTSKQQGWWSDKCNVCITLVARQAADRHKHKARAATHSHTCVCLWHPHRPCPTH